MGVLHILELANKTVLNIEILEDWLRRELYYGDTFSRDNPDDKPKDAEFRKLAEEWIPTLCLMREGILDYRISLRNIAYPQDAEYNVQDTE